MFLDFYPSKGSFKPEENLCFITETDLSNSEISFVVDIYHLQTKIFSESFDCEKKDGNGRVTISLRRVSLPNGGYIARIAAGSQKLFTAFDIQNCWTDFPRYGYVSDFSPGKTDMSEQISSMAKYHVNGVQFYDWQYRHDELLSRKTLYTDVFERPMSLDTVNVWIDECHKHGMTAMPYLAVYAASVDFWSKHKKWGMFDDNGEPLMFEDFLGLMDPSYQSEWFEHLNEECDRVLDNTAFDGLHIDQYGEPKRAFDSNGNEIDIPKAFTDFIDHRKDKGKGYVVFNAVGNWPTDYISKSKADFMYIEVWDYTPTFKELCDIVVEARVKSGYRPVVIPMYIKAKDFNNVLLADAVISASGGSHLEIGDGEKLLSDPYFPKAEHISEKQRKPLRKYWDFIVGYQNLLGPKADVVDINMQVKPDIITICRQNGKGKAINLINCRYEDKWTEPIAAIEEIKDIDVYIGCTKDVKYVAYASPDEEDIELKTLEYKTCDNGIKIRVPNLRYWSMIVIEEN